MATIDVDQRFDVAIFAKPPEVNYPVCLAAGRDGALYVGVDPQGSLGKEKGWGKVLRCVDADGDGAADQIIQVAEVDHPRGLIHDAGRLWVLHPPYLTLLHDDDRDGVADRREQLIDGVSTPSLVARRGADHTTNGIRMGIDGWIYIAVGDFGLEKAVGADGTTIVRKGGGVLRVRPDGGEMEIYAWGLRNIVDVAIDPLLNLFTRDNTNDGGGWDIRLSHIVQSAEYGYPSRYMNFAEETMPPLAQYGGGSGCGALYLQDASWPEPYDDALYTCDWGLSQVFRHQLQPEGATFAADQQVFLKIPRPTDVEFDTAGRMYVSSWLDGMFAYDGPNIGFVARIAPRGFQPRSLPVLAERTDEQLLAQLVGDSGAERLASQRELLRRGRDESRSARLQDLAGDQIKPLPGRVAALFTLKQLDGEAAQGALLQLAGDATIREFALRALTDRLGELDDLPNEPFLDALRDESPRVRAQAIISLGRLGRQHNAAAILPLTMRDADQPPPTALPVHSQADPGRVLPHLAVQALVQMHAVEPCLAALDGPYAAGALQALPSMHDEAVVAGLARRVSEARDGDQLRRMLTGLIRLYHREGDYRGDWWGTRPDTTGPYYDRQTWSGSEQVAQVLQAAAATADEATLAYLRSELQRHHVQLKGVALAAEESTKELAVGAPIEIPTAPGDQPNAIANLALEDALSGALAYDGDAVGGEQLFIRQSCAACHTTADGQAPKGPHLADIGKRYQPPELLESILRPSAKIAQGFDTQVLLMDSGKTYTGFSMLETAGAIRLQQSTGVPVDLPKDEIEYRTKADDSTMPEGLVNNLTPAQLANLLAYLLSL